MNFNLRGEAMRRSEKTAEYIFNENSVTSQLLAVIGTGEKAAVTSKQIKQSFGLTERELRKIVERCRRNGIYVLSSENGYFYPSCIDEVIAFVKRENGRIRNQCITLAPLKRYLKQLDSG